MESRHNSSTQHAWQCQSCERKAHVTCMAMTEQWHTRGVSHYLCDLAKVVERTCSLCYHLLIEAEDSLLQVWHYFRSWQLQNLHSHISRLGLHQITYLRLREAFAGLRACNLPGCLPQLCR